MPTDFNPLRMYKKLKFDDLWEDARIPEVLEYISGNKSLEIPQEWQKHLLP